MCHFINATRAKAVFKLLEHINDKQWKRLFGYCAQDVKNTRFVVKNSQFSLLFLNKCTLCLWQSTVPSQLQSVIIYLSVSFFCESKENYSYDVSVVFNVSRRLWFSRSPAGRWPASSSTARPSPRWSGTPWTPACSPPPGPTTWSASGTCRWSRATWAPGPRASRISRPSCSSCTRVSQRSRRSTGIPSCRA